MRGGLIIAVVLELGCGGAHVTLAPPPPTLTPEQRVATFHALSAVAEEVTVTRSCSSGGCSSSISRTLRLANGTEVVHPMDLLPVLPADSESARAIHGSERARRRANRWGLAAGAALVVAFALVVDKVNSEPEPDFSLTSGANIALYSLGVGALAGAGVTYYYRGEADRLQARANDWYTKGLADRLAVCAAGMTIVPCEVLRMPAAPPALSPPSAIEPISESQPPTGP